MIAVLFLVLGCSGSDIHKNEMNAGGIPYMISNPDPKAPTAYKANFENVSMEYFDV
jgi:hypothetical protein